MPRLSFVVPYYKKEKTLAKCLKSLYASSVKDIEVIVVFDGEDKAGEKIVDKFANKGIKKLVIEHGGAPKARNAGATLATGEFISSWDADCYIESGAAEVWLKVFDKYPDIDFCYSGYKFTPEGLGAINGEPFDPWLLQVNNYISGMFPIRREKAPKWDESLKSLQDWDFWLTAVKNGCKGYYIRGYGFKTEYPTKDSISGSASSNWLERLETVKAKHDIPLRDVCVSSLQDKEMGIILAKVIDADYRDYPTYFPNKYKTIIQLGFSPRMADVHATNFKNQFSKSKNVLFWRAPDVYTLRSEASRDAVDALAITMNGAVHKQYCDDHRTLAKMKDMGFNVELLPLPIDFSKDELKPLPEFKVLFDVDPAYKDLFDKVKQSMPDVKFDDMKGYIKAEDFTVLVKFQNDRSLDTNCKKMLLNGRYLISNIQAPLAGYVASEKTEFDIAKTDIIRAIRNLQEVKELNMEAVEWYRKECSPETFKEKMKEPELVMA